MSGFLLFTERVAAVGWRLVAGHHVSPWVIDVAEVELENTEVAIVSHQAIFECTLQSEQAFSTGSDCNLADPILLI